MKSRLMTGLVWTAMAVLPVLACGPWFPNRYFVDGDDTLARTPPTSFAFELKRALKTRKVVAVARKPEDSDPVRQVEVAADRDLRKALEGQPDSAVKRAVASMMAIRQKISGHRKRLEEHAWRREGEVPVYVARPTSDLPEEFGLYLDGAQHFYAGKVAEAIQCWKRVLDLPAERRRFRSTWAAYMIGKVRLADSPRDSRPWFRRVRELAAEGYVDSLGLSHDSLGWEALSYSRESCHVEALGLYLQQGRGGQSVDLVSVEKTIRRLLDGPVSRIRRAAQLPEQRAAITSWLIGEEAARDRIDAWLSVLEKEDLTDVDNADRLAWAAYQVGSYKSAARWLDRSPKTPVARWLKAKLLLRKGDVDGAAGLYAGLVAAFPVEDLGGPANRRLLGEWGTLQLGRGDYVGAMTVMIRGGHWLDAAYVAERVLTTDELKEFVDAGSGVDDKLRHLLARRLFRDGRRREAIAYFPESQKKSARELIEALSRSVLPDRKDEERAEDHWQAALLTRHSGLSLYGTEVAPDWYALGGNFELTDLKRDRSRMPGQQESKWTGSGADERLRLLEQPIQYEKRWHYRFLAADLAWKAVGLMPDNTEKLAARLRTAGLWLAARHPKEADRFYKALVRRNPDVPMAKEADRLRWFPPVD